MELEGYFDFLGPDDVRLKGSRIGIETILYEYIHRRQTPEAIAQRFDTLRLDQIYVTILYYLTHREEVDHYVADWLEFGERMRAEQARSPSPRLVRLRERMVALKSDRRTKGTMLAGTLPAGPLD